MKKTRTKLLILILVSNTVLFLVIIIVYHAAAIRHFLRDAERTLQNEITAISENPSAPYQPTYLTGNIAYLYLDTEGKVRLYDSDAFDSLMQYRREIGIEKEEIGKLCAETDMQSGQFYPYRTQRSYYVITCLDDYREQTGLVMVMYINIEPFIQYANSVNWVLFGLYIGISLIMGFIGLQMGSRIDSARDAQQRFFQNSSHELKTPLMSIQGYAEGIQMGVQEPEKASGVILRESERMAKLVEELLYISRLDAGQFQPHWKEADIREVIYDSIRTAQPLAEQKPCEIVIDRIDSAARAVCDEEQLTRALSNLLVNAVYHCRTEVHIWCRCETKHIMILIHNNGEQIPAEVQPHLFDRFYTGHQGGSGIGLSIAMEVIHLHHGRLRMENDSDGVTCGVWIPYDGRGFSHQRAT